MNRLIYHVCAETDQSWEQKVKLAWIIGKNACLGRNSNEMQTNPKNDSWGIWIDSMRVTLSDTKIFTPKNSQVDKEKLGIERWIAIGRSTQI